MGLWSTGTAWRLPAAKEKEKPKEGQMSEVDTVDTVRV